MRVCVCACAQVRKVLQNLEVVNCEIELLTTMNLIHYLNIILCNSILFNFKAIINIL